jgi:putative membrane protein
MKNLICFLCGIVVLFTASSCVDTKRAKNYNLLIDEGSVAFIQQGLEVNQTEIKAAKLAETHSNNTHLKQFAATMVANQASAGDELEKIAINNKVRGGDSVSTAHQQAIANIAKLSGTDFDKAYIQLVVTNHQNAVKLYSAATNDRIEDIQRFARKTLPVLKMHLDSANTINAGLK